MSQIAILLAASVYWITIRPSAAAETGNDNMWIGFPTEATSMKYKRFIIENYRAITGPLEIDVDRYSLMPIIGINESGKTTILQAIFAFDYVNDKLNDGGRHLKDVPNLYSTSAGSARVSADVALTADDFKSVLRDVEKERADGTLHTKTINAYRRSAPQLPAEVRITRDLTTKRYSLNWDPLKDSNANHWIAEGIIQRLPYILYFDDFRDSIEERIEIRKDATGQLIGWLSILEQLFKRTNPAFSVLTLGDLEDRQRKSVLAAVKKTLNDRLTKEWQNFRLDDVEALQINIDYEQDSSDGQDRSFLRLEVIDTDARGYDFYFYIRDRSKGFYWFFNFVMKLEFNPKVISSEGTEAIYLLDEPGSYLHSSAQSRLCIKLRELSTSSTVIYCTHSHYLLNPEVIPISTIRVADKDGFGNVSLTPIHDFPGSMRANHLAFQPVMDALHIKPFILDLTHRSVIIVEGIMDYYALEMLKGARSVNILPAVGARSVDYHVSSMLAWQARFAALWDNDVAGRESFALAQQHFGDDIASRHFHLIPSSPNRKRVLQDLFDGTDLSMIRNELGLPRNTSFDKTIASWYYTTGREKITESLSDRTHQNFGAVFDALGFPLDPESTT